MPPKKKGKAGGSKTSVKKGQSKTKANKKGKGKAKEDSKDSSTQARSDARDCWGWYSSWDKRPPDAPWYKLNEWPGPALPPYAWGGPGGQVCNLRPGPCDRRWNDTPGGSKDGEGKKGGKGGKNDKPKEKTAQELAKEEEDRAKGREEVCGIWQHECNLMHDICEDPRKQCDFGVSDDRCEHWKKQCTDMRDACYGSGPGGAGAEGAGAVGPSGPASNAAGSSQADKPSKKSNLKKSVPKKGKKKSK